MGWEVEFAKQLKKRNNRPPYPGALIGSVVSISPFKVTIDEGQYLLDDELHMTALASSRVFAVGDRALLIPCGKNQTFYVIDKVV